MNYTDIAEYLVLNNTPSKAKIVGNIIKSLKKKGYITTNQTHNYNGKNGGSSTVITVNENFLEQLLLAVFNTELPSVVENENTVVEPVLAANKEPTNPNQEFLDELAEMDLQQTAVAFDEVIPIFKDVLPEQNEFSDRIPEFEILELDLSPMDEVGFTSHLKKVIRLDFMSSLKSSLQMLIDNPKSWELEYCKKCLIHLIDEQKNRMVM
jgi:aspartyl aminopeptidase